MAVPNTFASATSAIPLANLDANFAYYDAGFSLSGSAVTFAGAITLTSGTANGVPYLNASKVLTSGAVLTFDGTILSSTRFAGALNGTVGATTASTGAFTTLSASSTISGAGFSTYLASPPAIGGTAAAAITGTTITANTGFAGPLNGTVGATTPAAGTFTTLSSTGNTTIGDAAADTITVNGQFVTGTVLKSAQALTNTLALAAYDVDGAAYTNLITLTASNTPTLALTSTGVGTINNMSIGATTASTGAFTTLTANSTVTFSGTTQVISLGTSQTTGTWTAGGASQTGAITLGQSTVNQTINIGTGATTAVSTKAINIGTAGVSGATTNINLGSAVAGSVNTITVNGGTANGVAYLDGSKVLTTGSALTFDGTNLGVGGYINSGNGNSQSYGGYANGGRIFALQAAGTTGAALAGATDTTANSVAIRAYTKEIANDTSYAFDIQTGNGTGVTTQKLQLTWSANGLWNSTGLKVIGNAEVTQSQLIGYSSYAGIGTNGLAVAGNVGIGTSSPQTKLDVLSANTATDTIGNAFIRTTDTQAADVGGKLTFGGLYNGSSYYAFGGVAGKKENSTSGNVAGYLQFLTTTSAGALTERMRLNSAGIVTMSAYGAGAATFSAAGVISSVSDETWKTKDGVPTNPDAMLNKLEPGYWYYNDEKKETFGSDRQLGFYAQNVNAAIGPEAAPVPEEGKPWGYYDRSVLAVTVMSLQKALATIESLTIRLATLEAK